MTDKTQTGPQHVAARDADTTSVVPDGVNSALRMLADVWGETRPSGGQAAISAEESPTRIGRFEIGRKLGEGGFGVVFLAEDTDLQRRVALKIARPEHLLDPDQRERFLREARLGAALNHPNIVTVHEVGGEGPSLYIAAEFCEGPDLAVWLHSQPELPSTTLTAEVGERIAKAVQFAHDNGIVHRDLKPANVLLFRSEGAVEPKVSDFGLAKLFAGDSGQSRSGTMIGTPSYMSPEQADADAEIGPAADVWALGGILYEMLTGRPPFRGGTVVETLRLARESEPVRPQTLRPDVPRDLETICLTCLRKEPEKRYPSAAALADDLRRFLEHRPILARRAGPFESARQWCRRNPWPAALIVALVLGVALSTFFAVLSEANAGRAEEAAALAEERRQLAEERERQRHEQWDRAERLLYAQQLRTALRQRDDANLTGVLGTLSATPERLRGWEYGLADHLMNRQGQRRFGRHEGGSFAIGFDAAGERLFSAGADGRVRCQDFATGEELWSSDDQGVRLFVLAVSPDGEAVAAAGEGRELRFWDARTGEPGGTMEFDVELFEALEISPTGRAVTLAGEKAWYWDEPSAEPRELPYEGVRDLTLTPDGERVVVALIDKTVRVWDVRSGREVCRTEPHSGELYCVAVSPDGERIAAGGGMTRAYLWDAETGSSLGTTEDVHARVFDLSYSPDGTRLTLGDRDGSVWLCDAETGAVTRRVVAHTKPILPVRFHPDGRHFATGSRDGDVKIWDAGRGQDLVSVPMDFFFASVSLSPDGKHAALSGRPLTVYDTASGGSVREFDSDGRQVTVAEYSPDGTKIAGAVVDKTLRIWDAITGRQLASLSGHSDLYNRLAFSPDGGRVALSDGAGDILIWRTDGDDPVCVCRGHEGGLGGIDFSPDGTRLASGGFDGTLRVWDARTGNELWLSRVEAGKVFSVAYTPDGRRIVTGGDAESIRFWNADNGGKVRDLSGLGHVMIGVAFADGGERMILALADGTIQVRDVASGIKLMEVPMGGWNPNFINSMSLSRDGSCLAAVVSGEGSAGTHGGDYRLQFWRAD